MENGKFRIGQSSLEVCQAILWDKGVVDRVNLICHEVGENYRQKYNTFEKRVKNFRNGFVRERQRGVCTKAYSLNDFLGLSLDKLDVDENQVWSISSCLESYGKKVHIPMMNFHAVKGIGLDELKDAVQSVVGSEKGVLLDSGRGTHYYGDFVLNPEEWREFNGKFLLPDCLVSPRYIGHRLCEGYSTLRLTSDKKYKPQIPRVVRVV